MSILVADARLVYHLGYKKLINAKDTTPRGENASASRGFTLAMRPHPFPHFKFSILHSQFCIPLGVILHKTDFKLCRPMLIIPIFPLDLVVLPGEPVPLHIFEPRYKQMLADCAPAAGERSYQPFGILYAQKNKLNEIGCAVIVDEILHKYPQGELDIMTYGYQSFKLLEAYHEKAYLTGLIEWIAEPEEVIDTPEREAVLTLYEQFLNLVEVYDSTLDPQTTQLSYEIAYRVNLEKQPKLRLLETFSENERLKLLRDYLEEAVPQIEQAKEFKRIVRSNGYFA